jgi:CheY-like chemotaxis protein
VAYDGPSALARAKASCPAVVLCDIGLPGMDGYEVARALRTALGKRFMLVALSGYARPEDVRKSTEAGFDAHIAKPAELERIADLLASFSGAA